MTGPPDREVTEDPPVRPDRDRRRAVESGVGEPLARRDGRRCGGDERGLLGDGLDHALLEGRERDDRRGADRRARDDERDDVLDLEPDLVVLGLGVDLAVLVLIDVVLDLVAVLVDEAQPLLEGGDPVLVEDHVDRDPALLAGLDRADRLQDRGVIGLGERALGDDLRRPIAGLHPLDRLDPANGEGPVVPARRRRHVEERQREVAPGESAELEEPAVAGGRSLDRED
jgi:hypothetical protein